MPNDFKSINEIINKDENFEKVRKTAESYSVVEQFHDVFPELKKVVKAVRVDNNTLFLKVENSVIRSELNFRRTLLIEKINNYFSKKVIKSIRFL